MDEFTSEDRSLLHEHGLGLYEEIAALRGISDDDDRIASGTPRREVFELLVRIGLVQPHHEKPDEWVPVDPANVQAQLIAPLSTEGTRLLSESSALAQDFAELSMAWRRSPAEAEAHRPFSYLHGADQIIAQIKGLVSECQEEMLTAQPQARRDTSADLDRALQTDSDLLKRGATMRTLYQHSARRSHATRIYVRAVTELGAEVRTLDEFFNRMIVFDRRVAIIPSPESLSTALLVREPSIVAYFVDVFERSWERARPFTSHDTQLMRDIAVEQRKMTKRLLVEGHSDPAAAKRLGVSPRTYAGYVADLKREFDAETRFQLGFYIGQQSRENEE